MLHVAAIGDRFVINFYRFYFRSFRCCSNNFIYNFPSLLRITKILNYLFCKVFFLIFYLAR